MLRGILEMQINHFIVNFVANLIQKKVNVFKMLFCPVQFLVLIISVILIINDLHLKEFNWHAIKYIMMSIPPYFTVLSGLIWFTVFLITVACHKANVFPKLVNVLKKNLEISRTNYENLLNLVKNNVGMFVYLFLLLIFHYSVFNAGVLFLWSFVCFCIPYVIVYTINNIKLQLILNK